ncbi:unnamed protein product [Arabidopsis lyrata]|nr:unnamed protein product [Arabidopsis lyrata]
MFSLSSKHNYNQRVPQYGSFLKKILKPTKFFGTSTDYIESEENEKSNDDQYDGRTHSLPYEKYGPYTCPKCNGVFDTSQKFAAHMSSHYKNETSEEREHRLRAKNKRKYCKLNHEIHGESQKSKQEDVVNNGEKNDDKAFQHLVIIVSPSLDRFQYRHIEEASFLELFSWDAEAGPSVPTSVFEDDGVIASFTYYLEDKEESVETPIPVIDLEEYEMVDSEAKPEMTMWEDYLILPDSLGDGSLLEGVPFLSSIGDPAIRFLTGDGTGHYASSCPTVRVGPSGKHLECLPLHRLLTTGPSQDVRVLCVDIGMVDP